MWGLPTWSTETLSTEAETQHMYTHAHICARVPSEQLNDTLHREHPPYVKLHQQSKSQLSHTHTHRHTHLNMSRRMCPVTVQHHLTCLQCLKELWCVLYSRLSRWQSLLKWVITRAGGEEEERKETWRLRQCERERLGPRLPSTERGGEGGRGRERECGGRVDRWVWQRVVPSNTPLRGVE